MTLGKQFVNFSNGVSLDFGNLLPIERDIRPSSDGKCVDVTYRYQNVCIEEDSLYSGSFWWRIAGLTYIDVPRCPSLPMHGDVFEIPEGMDAVVSVIDSSYIDIKSEITPARIILSENDTIGYSKQNVPPIADYEGFYPKSSAWLSCVGNYRGADIAYVGISPILYDHKNRIVRVNKELTYRIQFVPSVKPLSKTLGEKN